MSAVATAVRERPILFSGPMVRAILDGRKTQTRRVAMHRVCGVMLARLAFDPAPDAALCPYGAPGDRLWVRETWAWSGDREIPEAERIARGEIWYAADGDRGPAIRWRPSIHMPRWAARLTLEVTGVRVERLQDISATDCRAEGIPHFREFVVFGADAEQRREMYAAEYRRLWDSLNAPRGYGWDVNPWVWVVEFRKVPA